MNRTPFYMGLGMELGERRDSFTRMVVDDALRTVPHHGVQSAADFMYGNGVPFAVALRTLTQSGLPRKKQPEPPDN